MIMSEKEINDFQKAAQPLMKYLEYFHPHVTVIVDSERAEILESSAAVLKAKQKVTVNKPGTIEKIKAYREKHGCSLKEAVNAVGRK